jgi:hypothetical protein
MRWFIFSLLVMLFCSLCIEEAQGAGIGVSKAVISFTDVLKNGYAEEAVYVSTDNPNNVSLEYEFEGPAKDWLSVKETSELYISNTHGQWLTVAVSPPADAPNAAYNAIMRVRTGILNPNITGRIGSTVVASFAVQIEISITGKEIISCVPGGMSIPDTEDGKPVEVRLSLQNTGNVRLRPVVELKIWDQFKETVVQETTFQLDRDVLPTMTENFFTAVPGLELPIGQYWVETVVPECSAEVTEMTFSVLEKGAVSDKGQLLRIENKYFGFIGEIIPIHAIFRNDGERSVSAKFKGTIKLNNAVVKVIDTDPLTVLPQEQVSLEAFFEPGSLGIYEIQGRVLYNNKLTYEQGSLLEVVRGDDAKKRQKKQVSGWSYVGLLALIVLILVLLILIRKKHREKSKRKIMR